jgi:hypothetical protein
MTDLHAALLAAISAREERARAATAGPWKHIGRNWIEPATPIDVTEADWGPDGHTSMFVHTNEGQGAWRVEDVAFIAAEDPTSVLRQTTEDRWMLSQHNPDKTDLARGLDPECSCGYDLHRMCPHVLSITRRYGVDLSEPPGEGLMTTGDDMEALAKHPLHDVFTAGMSAATSSDFGTGDERDDRIVRYGLNVMNRVLAELAAAESHGCGKEQ